MMTDEQLRKIVAALSQSVTELSQSVTKMSREMAEAHKKTEAQIAKTEAQMAEAHKKTEAQIAEAHKKTETQMAEAHKKTEAQIAKSDRKMERLSKLAGDLTQGRGEIAEEFFYRSLENNPCLAGMRFELVDRNWSSRAGDIKGEYDIILANCDTLALVEVKARAKPKLCNYMVRTKIPCFRKLFSYYKDYKIIGAVASMVSNDELENAAKEKGLLLLTQQGNHICLVNDNFTVFQ